MHPEKITQQAIRLSVVLSTLTLLLYTYLGTFMRIFGDDWCTAVDGLVSDPFSTTLGMYNSWGGQYTNFFLKHLLAPLEPGIHLWFPALLIALSIFATYYFLSQFFKIIGVNTSQWIQLAATILIVFTFFRVMPSYQHVYWWAAYIPYTLPIIILIFWGGTILQYFSKPRSTMAFISLLLWSAIVVLINGGLIETMSIITGLLLAYMLLFAFTVPVTKRREYIILIVVTGFCAVVALAITLASPGSWERRQISIERDGVTLTLLEALPNGTLFALAYAFGEIAGFTFGQTFGIAFFGSLFLIAFIWSLFYLDRNPHITLPAPQNIPLVILIVIALYAFMQFTLIYPVVYAARGSLPVRPLILGRLIQLSAVLSLLYFMIVWAKRKNLLETLRTARTWSVVLVAMSILFIWIPASSLYKLAVFVPQFSEYAQNWDERHQFLLDQEPDAEIVYPGWDYYIEDEFIIVRESFSPNNPYNRCIANFYGIKSFAIEGGVEPPFIQ